VRELLPNTLQEVILGRLHRLPEKVANVLGACAVLGPDSTYDVLEDLMAEDDAPANTVRATVQGGLLTADGGGDGHVRFVHPLLLDVVGQELPQPLCAELHRRAVTSLATRASAPEDCRKALIRHTEAALRAIPPSEAIQPLKEAAERAEHRSMYSRALAWLGLAASLSASPDDEPERTEAELSVQLRRAEVASLVNGTSATSTQVIYDRIEHLGRVLRRPQSVSVLSGRFVGLLLRAEFARAEEMVPILLGVAVEEDATHLSAVAHLGRSVLLSARGQLSQARAASDECFTLLADSSTSDRFAGCSLHFAAHFWRSLMNLLAGEPEAARQVLEKLRHLIPTQPGSLAPEVVATLFLESLLRVLDNDADGALSSALSAAELAQDAQLHTLGWMVAAPLAWAKVNTHTGGPEDLAAAARSLDQAERAGFMLLTPLSLTLLADAERRVGRCQQARAHLRRVRDQAPRWRGETDHRATCRRI
jgi:hypothetical protein